MEERLQNQEYRRLLIEEIRGSENNKRQEKSLMEWDVFSGNISPYVTEKLRERFSITLVKEVPLVSSINILKKAVKARSSLYRQAPMREFTEVSDEQKEKIELVYKDMRADAQWLLANQLFELQHQTHALIEPRNGRLTLRPVKSHQLNVKPSDVDPEVGEIYIFSSYDKTLSDLKDQESDGYNQQIGDPDDPKLDEERYIVWSKSFHFVMDGKGNILTEDTISPLINEGVIPVVEVAGLKDFEYWIQGANEDADFTVSYNANQSMLGQIVEMQGFAQAYLKTTADLMPQSIDVGPTRILRLMVDPNDESGKATEFGYASPNSDIAGAREYSESLLSQYLSSQGIDPSSITGDGNSEKFTSGLDRFLAQIEKFESSQDVMDIFKHAESSAYKVIKAWLNTIQDDTLDSKYRISGRISDDSELIIEYKTPTASLTKTEQLDVLEREIDLGFKTREEALAEYKGITLEEARDMIEPEEEEFERI